MKPEDIVKFDVTDVSLASALLTMGCPLRDETPFTKLLTESGSTLTFFFLPEQDTLDLINIWENPEIDRDHPVALMKVFNVNRIGITKEIKTAVGLIELKKNNKIVLLTSNIPEHMKNKILSRL